MSNELGFAMENGEGLSNAFERLWSPHRLNYVTSSDKSRTFLELPTLSDEDGLIVSRGQHVYVVLNLYPYNPGHCMVVPYRQVANLEDLTAEEATELMFFTQKLIRIIKVVSNPSAINVGFNLGRAAGGSISEHLHEHVVPRWIGDASFITSVGNTKVMTQLLQETRRLLAEAWDQEG